MARYIVMLKDGRRRWYLEWSSVVDAPVTTGMTLPELRRYIREEYGRDGLRFLPERLERVKLKGSSTLDDASADDVLSFNRAGESETRLSKEQIIDYYCRRQGIGAKPRGKNR